MPRRKPTTICDVIGKLNLNPETCVEEYMQSKQHDKYFVKPPSWDIAQESVEMLFIENTREHEAQLALQANMLANNKRLRTANFGRTQVMYRMQEKLRRRFIRINGFIKECVDKRHKATTVIDEQTELQRQYKESIDYFNKSIDELLIFRDELKATVDKFQQYEKVINDVVAVSDIYQDTKDCVCRCDALMLAQVEIHNLEQRKLREIESMRQRMVQTTNEAALTVLGLKTDLARLERSYNEMRANVLKWEKILANAKNFISQSQLDQERTRDAMSCLFDILCQRRMIDLGLTGRAHTDGQLDFVFREIMLLKALLEELTANEKEGGAQAQTDMDVHC